MEIKMEVNIVEEILTFKKVIKEMSGHPFYAINFEVYHNNYCIELYLTYKGEYNLTKDFIKCIGGANNIIRITGGIKYFEFNLSDHHKFNKLIDYIKNLK